MKFDSNGILLADVPNAGVSTVDPNAKSGNPRHDARSGKFGAGGGGGKDTTTPPANIDPLDYKRMLDAVRQAALQFDGIPKIGDIKDYINGTAKNPSQVDIENFLKMVIEQKKNDLVDILDSQLRTKGLMPRARRVVRMVAPRGYVRKLLGQLDDNAVAEIMHRLENRGHDPAEVEAFFKGRVKDQVHQSATAMKNAIHASEFWEPVDIEFFEGTDTDWLANPRGDDEDRPEVVLMAEAIAKNIQPPVVHVNPVINVETPKTNKVITRDEKGLIRSIEDA